MSETISQSQNDSYAVSVGTAAAVLIEGAGGNQSGPDIATIGGTIDVPREVIIHNAHASQILYIGSGSDVTAANGLPIPAGGYKEMNILYSDEIWAIASGASTDTRVSVLHGKGDPA
jgi:hypothetical protein